MEEREKEEQERKKKEAKERKSRELSESRLKELEALKDQPSTGRRSIILN